MSVIDFVNIQGLFNHKLIADKDAMMYSNLGKDCCGISGSYLSPLILPNSTDVISIDGIPFMFPNKSINEYDNITCESQNIKVEFVNCSHMHVLGTCESDYFSEIIKIVFEDGSCEEANISFYDWTRQGAIFDFDISLNCKVALKSGNLGYNITKYIFRNEYNLKNIHKIIVSIELPFNPNMHIFAITLEK